MQTIGTVDVALRSQRSGGAWSHENIDIEREKFGDQRRHVLRLSVGVAFF
ncbi:hypothetical protein JQ609_06345 [Bradyrhizobium sp. AUGA SZCCT0169]|nr:hypothetical protein [Bradyrhizobium sp. AUGA SZCCT0169]MBR1246550.1 hypothetical protein [Bradyrhizobium sp. AUGA SZCCT0169]